MPSLCLSPRLCYQCVLNAFKADVSFFKKNTHPDGHSALLLRKALRGPVGQVAVLILISVIVMLQYFVEKCDVFVAAIFRLFSNSASLSSSYYTRAVQ